jgi:predicted esterase
MASLYTCEYPHQVKKLVLLAPALIWPDFVESPPEPVSVPTAVFHGTRDELIPIERSQELAEKVFLNLVFNAVDDDHGLYKTVHALDWETVLSDSL